MALRREPNWLQPIQRRNEANTNVGATAATLRKAVMEDNAQPKKKAPNGDYEVGYCRPPTKHRFKPGEVHNRRGRPRRRQTFSDALRKELAGKVTIRIDDTIVQVTKAVAIAQILLDKFAKGDAATRRLVFKLSQEFDRETTKEQNPTLSGVWTIPDDFDEAVDAAYKAERKRDPRGDEHELRGRVQQEALLTVGRPNDPGDSGRTTRPRRY